MSDYAQRLAAHPRWRWEPGMMDVNGSVVVALDYHGEAITAWRTPERIDEIGYESGCGAPPDIHHPATRGWLLAWLQRDAVAVQVNGHDVWCEWVDGASTRHNHYTGDDALAAALLAAWGAP